MTPSVNCESISLLRHRSEPASLELCQLDHFLLDDLDDDDDDGDGDSDDNDDGICYCYYDGGGGGGG